MAPGMAIGRSSQSSTGKISSHLESGVQAMSEVRPIRASSGSAQNAAIAKPQNQTTRVRQNAFFHARTNNEAKITTIVVNTCERAVSARANAAHFAYRRSSRTAFISKPRYTSESANDHEYENSPARVDATFPP